MATKKVDETNVRKLTNRGRNSISLTLPFELVKDLGWRAGKKVVIKVERGRVVLSGWKK